MGNQSRMQNLLTSFKNKHEAKITRNKKSMNILLKNDEINTKLEGYDTIRLDAIFSLPN